jgi:hypothetical protein
MSPREVQRAAGAWLLEASVLVAILPIVDQAVSDGGVTWKMALGSGFLSLISFLLGVYFKELGGTRDE